MSEWYDDPEFREWAAHVQKELVPKIEGSSMFMSLLPEGETDVKFALELGLAIMMNKPIIAIVKPGVHVPAKLARVVDQWVEGDLTQGPMEPMADRLQAAINAVVQDLPDEPDFLQEGDERA